MDEETTQVTEKEEVRNNNELAKGVFDGLGSGFLEVLLGALLP